MKLPCIAVLAIGFHLLSMQGNTQQLDTPQVWVGSWAAAQQIPEPQNSLPRAALQDATLREIVHLSIGGATLRVRLSNAFGTQPLHFGSVHIAHAVSPASSEIAPRSDVALTFSGQPDVTIPAGAEYLSDPIAYPVQALSDLAISFYLDQPPAQQTGHPGSRETTWYLHGNQVSASSLAEAQRQDHWYQLSGIEVLAPRDAAAVAVLGDSITDGHGATTNGNDRWTDVLSARLESSPATKPIGVLNEGIGGNHLLIDGLGPNALARFDRDVLGQAAVRWVIVFEGINDLGGLTRDVDASQAEHQIMVHRIIAAYEQIIDRAHAHGVLAIGATLTPFVGSEYYHPGPASEADRQKINLWIRTQGHFDAVVDFDSVLRDPAHPDRLLLDYDSGDHLHPSPAGYRAMGNAIPLSLFVEPNSGTR